MGEQRRKRYQELERQRLVEESQESKQQKCNQINNAILVHQAIILLTQILVWNVLFVLMKVENMLYFHVVIFAFVKTVLHESQITNVQFVGMKFKIFSEYMIKKLDKKNLVEY